MNPIESIVTRARQAALRLAASTEEERNEALRLFNFELQKQQARIEASNKKDLEEAEASVKAGKLEATVLKRLECQGKKLESCLSGIDEVIAKKDPLGICSLATELTEGLHLYKVSCPIGVLAVIFEARPEAGIQIASLAVKSGNAVILKGGHEAKHSNHAIFESLKSALRQSAIPEDSVQLLDTREEVAELLKLDALIDLVIPRGSKGLVNYIKANTKIPVLGHADGLCSAYIHEDANIATAVKVVVDSKTDYPAACNALETIVVHEKVAPVFLPKLAKALEPHNVKFRADPLCFQYLPPQLATHAIKQDFVTEFLNLTLAVKSVKSVEEAIQHINNHGSHHTDVILTENFNIADQFMNGVDSAGVYHNCSSRFADGFRYGFGAEVGISTNRIHSRGPVGLEGLLIYKYKLFGHGNTVNEINEGKKAFSHRALKIPSKVEASTVPQ